MHKCKVCVQFEREDELKKQLLHQQPVDVCRRVRAIICGEEGERRRERKEQKERMQALHLVSLFGERGRKRARERKSEHSVTGSLFLHRKKSLKILATGLSFILSPLSLSLFISLPFIFPLSSFYLPCKLIKLMMICVPLIELQVSSEAHPCSCSLFN